MNNSSMLFASLLTAGGLSMFTGIAVEFIKKVWLTKDANNALLMVVAFVVAEIGSFLGVLFTEPITMLHLETAFVLGITVAAGSSWLYNGYKNVGDYLQSSLASIASGRTPAAPPTNIGDPAGVAVAPNVTETVD